MSDLDTPGGVTPRKKPAILFIDDDLRPPRFVTLPEVLQHTLADISSPDLAALWELGRAKLGLPQLASITPNVALERAQREDFVNQVLLSDDAYNTVSEDMRTGLDSVRTQRESIAGFADSVRKAFPGEAFELKELYERPNDKKTLLEADLLILDLVMGGGDPVEKVKAFLLELSNAAENGEIPPILLVSLHDELLKESHLAIRSKAHISASGLFVLSKADIKAPTGQFMLGALWTQLRDRQAAAGKMRALCLAVYKAFDAVREQTMQTLWSLDVASMQQIYVTARTENDSYNEHVLELFAREVLWHFETDESIRESLDRLNDEFASSVNESSSKPAVIFRYPSFIGIDMEALHALVNHHSCTPLLPEKTVTDLDVAKHPWGVPGVLPFGAVIVSNEFQATGEILINITPQCDLIKKRIVSDSLSLTFVTARAHLAQAKATRGEGIVVQGVAFEGRYYDLEVFPNRTLSCKADRLLRVAKAGRWNVKARLRTDIAKQIQQEVASHLSRRDVLSSTRGDEVSCRICIKINKDVNWYSEGAFGEARHVALSSTGSSKHHILDQEAFEVSTWVASMLASKLGEDPFGKASFVSKLCSALQMGIEKSQDHGGVQFKVESYAVESMEEKAGQAAIPKGTKALLFILIARAA